MQTMQAYVRTSANNQTVELAEVPVPVPGENEVLVKVEALGVGIHDRYFIPEDASFPYTIGTEASGIIVKAGSEVTQYKVEDRVILMSVLLATGGCWADYVVVPADALYPIPEQMSFMDGAAIPIAGKTALECMRGLDLAAGDTLFVAGASGAIGTLVIQLAAARGIRVGGSASQRNQDYMLSLGAEKAVDYADPNWKEQIREWVPGGVSAALAIQPDTTRGSMDVVARGGKVISVSRDRVESKMDVAVQQLEHHADTRPAMVKFIADIAEQGIRLVIEHVYPFDEAMDALGKTETRHARGKNVVRIAHD